MEEQENINVKRNMTENLEPVLVNVDKPDLSNSIHIDKDEFKIGRGKANDEIIMHISISRQHCIFKRDGGGDGGWSIQDTSSSGTFLNGNQMSQGEIQPIKIGDLLQLGPMPEFSYKFEISKKNEPLAKRLRMSTSDIDLSQIIMRQKTFEESQQLERDNLAERMKAKHNEQLELKNELEKLLNDRKAALGEKDHLNKQINTLEKNIEDVKVAEMNLEKLNRDLSERLDKERQEFEVKLNEEKEKMKYALEMSRKEKEILENNMREQLEKLKNEQQIEYKKLTESLEEEKKTAEKLQCEKVEFAQKLKKMEDALVKTEAKANELQTTLEKQNAAKAPTFMALTTIVDNVEIVDDSNVKFLDTIDLTNDVAAGVGNFSETSSAESASKDVFNKVGDIMDEQLTCSICSELFVTAVTLNCTHTFCQYCINCWIKKKKECPVCRSGITAMNRSLVLDNFIDKMVENLSSDHKTRRTEIVDERRESERLAATVNKGNGKRGRGRARGANANANTNANLNANANANPNRTRGASTAATRTSGQNQQPSHTTDGDTDRNYASESSGRLSQQSTSTGGASVHEQVATTQGSSDAVERINDSDDSDGPTWSIASGPSTDEDDDGDGDGNGDSDDTNSVSSSYSVSQTSEDPATQFSDMDDFSVDSDDDSTDNNWGGVDWDDEFFGEAQDEEDHADGLPGAPYGGYGACYYCGNRGHWAPGCPYR